MKNKVCYRRDTHDPDGKPKKLTKHQELVWSKGINGFTGHMGDSCFPMTLDNIYNAHLEYAAQHVENAPTKEEVLQALTELVDADLYKMVEL